MKKISVIPILLILLTCGIQLKAQVREQITNANLTRLNGQVLTVAYKNNTQQGANAFNSKFNVNATGRNNVNAYLLSVLAVAAYADGILEIENPGITSAQKKIKEDPLQKNGQLFFSKFKTVMNPYFSSTSQYTGDDMRYFEDTRDFDGYDPEAIIVPTANAIFVTFRGTDKVRQRNQNNPLAPVAYEVGEWLQTDFNAMPYTPPNMAFVGQVHEGMWRSLMKVADTMAKRIVQLDGRNKKIWITGHSLGCGLAQLFAYYLAKQYQIQPQGLYLYASPQVGNSAFNTDFARVIGGANKIQRFDFMDDPVTAFATLVGYKPIGIRNLFTNIDNMTFNAPERSANEIARILGSAPGSALTSFTPIGFGGMCFHQQNWYMQATNKQLSQAEKNDLPICIRVPDNTYLGCQSGLDIARAVDYRNPVGQTLNKMVELVDDITNTIGVLAQNITGAALTTGVGLYKITCMKDGKNLAVTGTNGQNGRLMILWQEDGGNNMRFEVFKKGAAYGIKMRGTNRVLDVVDGSNNNGARIQIWDDNITSLPFQNNQIWYFHNVGGNRYVLQNEKSRKVLEAQSDNTNSNGCVVMQNGFKNNALSQVWVFEKIN